MRIFHAEDSQEVVTPSSSDSLRFRYDFRLVTRGVDRGTGQRTIISLGCPCYCGGSIGVAIHIVYNSLAYIFLVPCCEVIGQYIHAQREVFQNHLKTPNIVSNSSSHATIEDIRLNICRIKALKNKINDLWGWPLFTTFGSLVFLTCLCVYAVLGSSIGRGDTWIGISYSVFLWSTTLEIASVSQYMKDEVSFIQSRLVPLKHENISVVQYFLCDIHI